MITNQQYLGFMQALAADQQKQNGLLLNDFEREFLASWVKSDQQVQWFTPRRNLVIDRMWMRYGGELNLPHPADRITERPKIADADPEGCQYIVKDETGQHRCNDPATCREPGRLRYCEMHGDVVRKACKGTALVKFP